MHTEEDIGTMAAHVEHTDTHTLSLSYFDSRPYTLSPSLSLTQTHFSKHLIHYCL